MISSNITIPDASNAAAILTHPNAASWAMRQYHQAQPQTGNQQMMDHPPQASSPMLSQQSSPSSSRATSPNRTSSCDSGMQQSSTQQNSTQVRNMQRIGQTSLKNIRRPSAETTPPPPMMANELIMPQSMKQIQEVSNIINVHTYLYMYACVYDDKLYNLLRIVIELISSSFVCCNYYNF